MTSIPSPSPFEAPVPGAEAVTNTAAQRAALAQSITPTAAPGVAMETLGSTVAPNILSTLAYTGAAVVALLGMKTIMTGKPPWKKQETV